jgi:protein-tyrosine phosphatase
MGHDQSIHAGRFEGRAIMVLIVCTGNIARSPMAERLLEARLSGSGIVIGSAGTAAFPGAPMAALAQRALEEVGIDPAGFSSRALGADLVQASDLVLTATRQQRSEVVQMAPTSLRRVFTLREFSRLLDQDKGPATLDSLSGLATAMAGRRGRFWVAESVDDIADPYGGSLEDYRTCRDELVEAIDAIAPVLISIRER